MTDPARYRESVDLFCDGTATTAAGASRAAITMAFRSNIVLEPAVQVKIFYVESLLAWEVDFHFQLLVKIAIE